jgi:hypothetical protein
LPAKGQQQVAIWPAQSPRHERLADVARLPTGTKTPRNSCKIPLTAAGVAGNIFEFEDTL